MWKLIAEVYEFHLAGFNLRIRTWRVDRHCSCEMPAQTRGATVYQTARRADLETGENVQRDLCSSKTLMNKIRYQKKRVTEAALDWSKYVDSEMLQQ
jgi:hypothetical protein